MPDRRTVTPSRLKASVSFRSRRAARRARTHMSEHRLRLRNVVGRDPHSREVADVLVSMTTHPARIRTTFLSIESILAGTLRPKALHLWLAADEWPSSVDLPKSLERLQSRGLEVHIVDPNLRPGNKLIHALRYFPDDTIVVADDDVHYPRTWLQQLVEAHRRRPEVICGHNTVRLTLRPDGGFIPYHEMPQRSDTSQGPSHSLLPLGVGGVLYPPGSLAPEVHDTDKYLRISPVTDDLWFKAMAYLAGTPTYRVSRHQVHFRSVSRKPDPLWRGNRRRGINDQVLGRLDADYGLGGACWS